MFPFTKFLPAKSFTVLAIFEDGLVKNLLWNIMALTQKKKHSHMIALVQKKDILGIAIAL